MLDKPLNILTYHGKICLKILWPNMDCPTGFISLSPIKYLSLLLSEIPVKTLCTSLSHGYISAHASA